MKKKKPSSDARSTVTATNTAPATATTTPTFESATEFLAHSLTVPLCSLKPLIHSLPLPSSPFDSLPSSLHSSILSSLSSFKQDESSHSRPPSPSNSPLPKKSRLDPLIPIRVYAHITRLLFTHPENPFSADQILPCVQSLHDNLVLFESDDTLLFQISSVCEDWWKEKFDGKELLISQSLPYFLSRALTVGKKSDVKRIFSLREAFGLFDYEDESIEDLKLLLLRSIIAPVFLKVDEGRRFLSFILCLDEKLAKEAMALIKSQIPIGKKSVLVEYGEIVFKAWKGAERGNFANFKEEIEDGFLQGLIEAAIHARSSVLGANVRRVLGGFIEQRTTGGVEKLLFRLSEPILFRSLQVANSEVRFNTLHLFLDLFPILDPDSTREEKDTLLEKQLFFLEKLLMDSSPEIRALSIEGLFKILHLFWEIVPSSIIAKLLTKVFDEMSLESCKEVRVSCLNGAKYLVENPLSHEILKVLLLKTGRMVLDPALSVRVASIDLLLTVRDTIRSLKFTKIVSLDSLLSLLANDQTRVAQKITSLLLPTYFPSKIPSKDSCIRCISLIRRNPFAGGRFCKYLFSEGSSVKSLVELVRVSLLLTLSPERDLDQEQTDGLIVAISNVIDSFLSDESFSNLDLIKRIITFEKLEHLIGLVSSDLAREAVLNIALSLSLSPDNMDLKFLRDFCMEIILNLIDSENLGVLEAARKVIFEFKWSEFMLEGFTNVLESASNSFSTFPTDNSSKRKKRAKRESKSCNSKPGFDIAENAVRVALQVKELVASEETMDVVLESRFSDRIFSCFNVLSRILIENGVRFENLDVSPIILAFLSHAMCVTIRESHSSSRPPPPHSAIFDGSLDHVLTCLSQALDKKDSEVSGGEKNMMKICTSVLKFILYSTSKNPIKPENLLKCLKFASTYKKCIFYTLQTKHTDFEGSNRDILILLKSSFTYSLKLSNLFLASSDEILYTGTDTVFYLSNCILDLVPVVETLFGTKSASILVPIMKVWLPVLILGLGCTKLIVPVNETSTKIDANDNDVPFWLETLAKHNLVRENDEASQQEGEDRDNQVSNFEKLMEKLVVFLKKGDAKILDAVGSGFISVMGAGLEKKDYNLVLGLSRFVCIKLLGNYVGDFEKLEFIHGSLKEILNGLENCFNEDGLCEEEKEMLGDVMEMVRSVLPLAW